MISHQSKRRGFMSRSAPLVAIVVACGLFLAESGTNLAKAREDASAMLCRDVQVLVRENGRVVLATGGYTFSMFVAGRRYCLPNEMTIPALTRTLDRKRCRAGYHCVGRDENDGN